MFAANDCSIDYHTDEVTTSIIPILMQISMPASENAALYFYAKINERNSS